MKTALGLVLASAASLALAQAPAQPAPKSAPPGAQKSQVAKKPQKAHAKPTPEQVRKFNELQKKPGAR